MALFLLIIGSMHFKWHYLINCLLILHSSSQFQRLFQSTSKLWEIKRFFIAYAFHGWSHTRQTNLNKNHNLTSYHAQLVEITFPISNLFPKSLSSPQYVSLISSLIALISTIFLIPCVAGTSAMSHEYPVSFVPCSVTLLLLPSFAPLTPKQGNTMLLILPSLNLPYLLRPYPIQDLPIAPIHHLFHQAMAW